jgi:hypothetical protein
MMNKILESMDNNDGENYAIRSFTIFIKTKPTYNPSHTTYVLYRHTSKQPHVSANLTAIIKLYTYEDKKKNYIVAILFG